MATDYLRQVRNALETPMTELGEMDFQPEFSDSAIYVTVGEAVTDYNIAFNTSHVATVTTSEETGLATAISISPEPADDRARIIALYAAYSLLREWITQNLLKGQLGVDLRDGLSSLSTSSRATHSRGILRDLKADLLSLVSTIKLRQSTVLADFRENATEG